MKIINKIHSNKYDNRVALTFVRFLGPLFSKYLECNGNKIFELLNNNNNFPIYSKGVITDVKIGKMCIRSNEINISKWEPLGFRRNVLYA